MSAATIFSVVLARATSSLSSLACGREARLKQRDGFVQKKLLSLGLEMHGRRDNVTLAGVSQAGKQASERARNSLASRETGVAMNTLQKISLHVSRRRRRRIPYLTNEPRPTADRPNEGNESLSRNITSRLKIGALKQK